MLGKSAKILIGVAAAVVVVGGIIVISRAGSQVKYETATVDLGPVVEEISVTGSIAPMSRIGLQPEVGGKVTKILVKEGDEVKEGDILLRLDSRDIEARVAAQDAAVAAARAQLRILQVGATPEDLRVSEAAVDTAKAQYDAAVMTKSSAERALENAQKSRENTLAGSDTYISSKVSTFANDYDAAATAAGDAIDRLTAPIFNSDGYLNFSSADARAESQVVNSRQEAKFAAPRLLAAAARVRAAMTAAAAKAEYDSVIADLGVVKRHADDCASVLNSAPYVNSTTLATWRANVSAAQTSLNTVIETIGADQSGLDLQERLNATDLTGAEIAVDNAKAALDAAGKAISTAEKAVAQAEANYQLKKTGARLEDIDAQKARVRAEEAALSGLLAELSKRRIAAPLDAVVTDVAAEPGENVQPGKTVISVDAKGQFEIEANISEVDIAKIKIGEPVNITLDAFPSTEVWTGKVATVNPAERVVEGVIFYKTKIVFDQNDPRLRAGLTANLDIEVGRADNAVRIPIRALLEKPGRTYVQVVVDGKAQERDVVVGLENTEFVEIKSGLGVGDLVVVGTAAQ